MKNINKNYVYIILDVTISGEWLYKDKKFEYKPIYVGMGVDYRYRCHLTTKLKKGESNFTKFNLIKDRIINGDTPLSIKIYENLERENAKQIEIEIIKHFGKICDGTGFLTNITDGGDETRCNKIGGDNLHSKKVYQYSLLGEFIKEWDCMREVGRILNFGGIGDCCRGKTQTSHGFQWSYIYHDKMSIVKRNNNDKKHKIVYKFNDDGILIKTYNSLNEASLENNICKGNLSKCVINDGFYNNSYYSYDEYFKIDFDKLKKIKTHKKHKIIFENEILYLTNEEIIEKFNVSKYYVNYQKKNNVKNPKFKVIY